MLVPPIMSTGTPEVKTTKERKKKKKKRQNTLFQTPRLHSATTPKQVHKQTNHTQPTTRTRQRPALAQTSASARTEVFHDREHTGVSETFRTTAAEHLKCKRSRRKS